MKPVSQGPVNMGVGAYLFGDPSPIFQIGEGSFTNPEPGHEHDLFDSR